MAIDIERTMRRTWRYWFEDGLAEIGMGCLFGAVGLLFLVEARLPEGALRALASVAGLPALVLGGGWLMSRLVTAAKQRLTYPRTGYVAYRRDPSRRRRIRGLVGGAVMGALGGALLGVLVAVVPSYQALIPALDGVLIGAGLLYLGHRFDLPRFFALAAFSALAGALASLRGLGDLVGTAAYFGALGVALVASGGLALSAYLRRTQPLAGAEDHGQ